LIPLFAAKKLRRPQAPLKGKLCLRQYYRAFGQAYNRHYWKIPINFICRVWWLRICHITLPLLIFKVLEIAYRDITWLTPNANYAASLAGQAMFNH